jgi:dTDP-4-dehydrorhamnose 3,5-epimerase
MKVVTTTLPGVLLIEPACHKDARGYLMETWNARDFAAATGVEAHFVQDTQSSSREGVLRGIHYQAVTPAGKLVRVLAGAIFDVAVDLRRSSPFFGRWVGTELSAASRRQLWIPAGFGHAFLALSPDAEVFYKSTTLWQAALDRAIRWDDPRIGIDWPLKGRPLLSVRDANAPSLHEAEVYD